MGVTHHWRGVKHREGWQEWFTAPHGLPPRDLTEEDVAGFDATQLDKLHSPAGQRLYVPAEEETKEKAPKAQPKAARPRVTLDDDGARAENGDTDGNE